MSGDHLVIYFGGWKDAESAKERSKGMMEKATTRVCEK
jgi:hypothetical protein